jgi:hypothetical protein
MSQSAERQPIKVRELIAASEETVRADEWHFFSKLHGGAR